MHTFWKSDVLPGLCRNGLAIVLIMATVILTVYFYFQKYQLGLVRYFDVDEFAYLNFAHQLLTGSKPYQDFIYLSPPGYLFFLIPIVGYVSPESVLTVMRQAVFGSFVFLSAGAAFLFWQMRKSRWWVAVPLILVFLPLPSDKFLESRPDTLMMALFTLGVAFQIRALQSAFAKSGGHVTSRGSDVYSASADFSVRSQKPSALQKSERDESLFPFFLSGFFYSAATFVLQKTFLLIPWSIIVILFWLIRGQKHGGWKQNISVLAVFGFGLSSFLWVLLFWSYSQGTLGNLWYYLVVFVKESNVLASLYPFPLYLLYLPNGAYYGLDGYHTGFLLNAILWIGAVPLSVLAIFVSFIKYRKKARFYTDLLLNGFLIFTLFIYWRFPSMKHPQYLIPASVFVVLVWTDTISSIWNSIKKNLFGVVGFSCVYAIVLLYLFRGYQDVNTVKFYWHNGFDKKMLIFLTEHIPKSDYVLDLVGLAYLYPQPYFFCCIPFGQFQPYLSRLFPSLLDALVRTDTKYIYQGTSWRMMALSEKDQQYIKSRFTQVGCGALLVRNDMLSAFQNVDVP